MKYLTYAGIGSEETPKHILTIMHHIGAYLCSEGWILRSGGASGADKTFEKGVNDQTVEGDSPDLRKEIYLPWKGFNNSQSTLNPSIIPFSQEEQNFTAKFHPAWDKCSPSAKLLHQRNTRQIIGHESVSGPNVALSKFVVCWTDRGLLKGGTAQALRIAQALDVPIINLGKATNPQELEALVLEVDRLQKEAKGIVNG